MLASSRSVGERKNTFCILFHHQHPKTEMCDKNLFKWQCQVKMRWTMAFMTRHHIWCQQKNYSSSSSSCSFHVRLSSRLLSFFRLYDDGELRKIKIIEKIREKQSVKVSRVIIILYNHLHVFNQFFLIFSPRHTCERIPYGLLILISSSNPLILYWDERRMGKEAENSLKRLPER